MLLESVYDEGPANGPFGRKLEGYVVPINCENAGARCVPATYQERQDVSRLIEGTLYNSALSCSEKYLRNRP